MNVCVLLIINNHRFSHTYTRFSPNPNNLLCLLWINMIQQFAEVKKQTVFFLQTAEIWSTFSATDVCRCGPQTADVLPLKKQTTPQLVIIKDTKCNLLLKAFLSFS
ncbi:hypothetical protein Hanom_Chr16g01456581 [Helianthus anomalus]